MRTRSKWAGNGVCDRRLCSKEDSARIASHARFGVFQVQLELIEQALLSLRAHSVAHLLQVLDFEVQMNGEGFGVGGGGGASALIPLSFRSRCADFALPLRGSLSQDHQMYGGKVGTKRVGVVRHD